MLLINNVQMIDAFSSRYGSLLIEEGKIKVIIDTDQPTEMEHLSKLASSVDIKIIEGEGLTLMPAFIDIHCHLRYPGFEYKEDLESGQRAALKGGYSTLVAMANTKPACDNEETLKGILQKSKELDLCDIYQAAAITKGLEGKELVAFQELLLHTSLFSDDGNTIFNQDIMKSAIEASNKDKFKILVHAQPETQIIERDLVLAEELGGSLHFCHVSKAASLKLIKEAKAKGMAITCEVAPHHLFAHGLDYRVNPSFRGEEDVKSLLKGITEGSIDMIATDHAPHSQEDKEKGAPGISSIEVAFSMVNTVLQENGIELNTLSRLMSYQPAKFLGINSGLIKEGYEANLVLVDLKEKFQLKPEEFISKGKNNPFAGAILKGRVKMTLKRGRAMYDDKQKISGGISQ